MEIQAKEKDNFDFAFFPLLEFLLVRSIQAFFLSLNII